MDTEVEVVLAPRGEALVALAALEGQLPRVPAHVPLEALVRLRGVRDVLEFNSFLRDRKRRFKNIFMGKIQQFSILPHRNRRVR